MPNANRKRTAALTVETIPISALVPHQKNARVHTERHVQQLAKSVETFGFNVPVLVDGDNRVIAGHGRLLAVASLGWTEIPIIRLEHLTPEQVRAFRIADNRLNEIHLE